MFAEEEARERLQSRVTGLRLCFVERCFSGGHWLKFMVSAICFVQVRIQLEPTRTAMWKFPSIPSPMEAIDFRD